MYLTEVGGLQHSHTIVGHVEAAAPGCLQSKPSGAVLVKPLLVGLHTAAVAADTMVAEGAGPGAGAVAAKERTDCQQKGGVEELFACGGARPV